MDQPACMTTDELAFWHEGDAFFRKQGRRIGTPCIDCPLAFAAEMREKGCCNGNPGTAMRLGPLGKTARVSKYATEEERHEARKLSWRMYYRRRLERMAS